MSECCYEAHSCVALLPTRERFHVFDNALLVCFTWQLNLHFQAPVVLRCVVKLQGTSEVTLTQVSAANAESWWLAHTLPLWLSQAYQHDHHHFVKLPVSVDLKQQLPSVAAATMCCQTNHQCTTTFQQRRSTATTCTSVHPEQLCQTLSILWNNMTANAINRASFVVMSAKVRGHAKLMLQDSTQQDQLAQAECPGLLGCTG